MIHIYNILKITYCYISTHFSYYSFRKFSNHKIEQIYCNCKRKNCLIKQGYYNFGVFFYKNRNNFSVNYSRTMDHIFNGVHKKFVLKDKTKIFCY